MNTMKLKIADLWKKYNWTLLFAVSIILVASMIIGLLVNSGIAQKLAEYADAIYIVNALWFAVIAFVSCKRLREDKPVETPARGKYTKKTKGDY